MTRIDPHSFFDDQQPLTKSLQLQLKVDFQRKVLIGEVTLYFLDSHGGALDLDTRGLTIHRVYRGTDDTPIPFELGSEEPILGRRLRMTVPDGFDAVTIDYETSPRASGLQWLDAAQTEGKRHPFLFSQCQQIHARSMVPCQDSPVARVRFDAEILVPEPLTAVMSADSVKVESTGNGWRKFSFLMPQAIPTYLLALAVGELEARELSHRARIWAEPAIVEKAEWEFMEVESFIRKAEGIFGPYDWDRYDMLVLPPSFPYGGMENPRMTFLTPTLLAGDRSMVDVLAHELAHSWTGNLVTNATAEHFWLNEGFTVWAERRILRAIYGRERELMAWAIGQKSLEDSLDRFRDHPELTVLRTHLAGVDPDDAFSTVPYEKGARFVWAMEQAMGSDLFDHFIQDYMKRFRFTSISTEEFCAFMEEKSPGLLASIHAEVWLYQPGLPKDAPTFTSPRLEALINQALDWRKGVRPDRVQVASWDPMEVQIFLQHLPKEQSREECAWLDSHLSLSARGNFEVLVEWLVIAAASDYQPAFDKIRAVLLRVGRMKYLRPLYRALGSHHCTQELARAIYIEAAPGYHALSRRVVENVMEKWPTLVTA